MQLLFVKFSLFLLTFFLQIIILMVINQIPMQMQERI